MTAQKTLVEALLKYEVLRFGDFFTKSGRLSPYFFNTGAFHSSESMGLLAELYAQAIFARHARKVRYLYGPAYKGIPLVVMIADRLAKLSGEPIFFTFNRKEIKDHGEGGSLVGYVYQGGEEVLIVEDVLTGGTSLRESLKTLSPYHIQVKGAWVAIDRQERGSSTRSARQEIEEDYQIPVFSLMTLSEIIDCLANNEVLGRRWLDKPQLEKIAAYVKQYGVQSLF